MSDSFHSVAEAQAAGFRPCLRCRPSTARANSVDRIRAYIETNHVDRPVRLAELGRVAGMSPFTVQRLFKHAMGVSPLQYQRALKAGRLRSALKQGEPVTDAIYTAGFESPEPRLRGCAARHDPGAVCARRGRRGDSLGGRPVALRMGDRGRDPSEVSAGFPSRPRRPRPRPACARSFRRPPSASDPSLSRLVDAALQSVREGTDLESRNRIGALDLRGTVFQLRVWQALRQIPRGETRSYSELARELGDPNATRAVARACATESGGPASPVPSGRGRKRLVDGLPLGRGTQTAVARGRERTRLPFLVHSLCLGLVTVNYELPTRNFFRNASDRSRASRAASGL